MSSPLTGFPDQEQLEAITSRSFIPQDTSRIVLKRICCRCLCRHRYCAGRKVVMGEPALCRPRSSFLEGRRLGQHKVPLRHYGSNDDGPGKERLPGRDRFRCRAL